MAAPIFDIHHTHANTIGSHVRSYSVSFRFWHVDMADFLFPVLTRYHNFKRNVCCCTRNSSLSINHFFIIQQYPHIQFIHAKIYQINPMMPPNSSMEQLQDDEAVVKDIHPYTSELAAGTTFVHVELAALAMNDARAASSSSSSSSLRKVHFGPVKTRYYHHILGDHPHCSDGLPLTFGWTYHDCDDDDDYDDFHYGYGENSGVNSGIKNVPMCHLSTFPPDMTSRKRAIVPKLTILARMSILLESGLSEEDIVKCIHKYHRNRRQTCNKDRRAKLWMGILKSFGFRYRQ